MKIIESLTGLNFSEIVFPRGAAKGTLWPQIMADVLNCRVKVPVVKESTSLGAALYAGLGVGLYHDLKSVAQSIVSFEKTYEPDPPNHQIYQELYEQWSRLYERSLSMLEEGLIRPLRRAAAPQSVSPTIPSRHPHPTHRTPHTTAPP